MINPRRVRLSILDLAPIVQGSNASEALRNSLDLAQHAERWGYHRHWVAEHHNMVGVASAATSVLIGYLAGGTSTIRVGAGGIMLPNHSPLVIAEHFGTLEAMYPGRIDLGLGRAPGSDLNTARALRRKAGGSGDEFPEDVQELQSYFAGTAPVKAVPGIGANVPLYILGSSDFGARLAAALGLPFAFASHFAPAYLERALDLYRRNFRPSEALSKPYVMIGVNVLAADTDEEARFLFSSHQQAILSMLRNSRSQLPPPVQSFEESLSPEERAAIGQWTAISAIGSPETVRRKLEVFLELTGADELIATGQVFDHKARLRSYEILADVFYSHFGSRLKSSA
jgi:luciferase family oxidoreductase group 1